MQQKEKLIESGILVLLQTKYQGETMSHYHHITQREREYILIYKAQGLSVSRIAELIGRSKYHEIKIYK